jgi:LPS sulfotransferase NodH
MLRLRFSTILVVTYGRTGSTLLNGVLNSIPGVLVRGENQNMFAGLYQGLLRLRSTRERYAENAHCPTSPFFGTHRLCEQRYVAYARELARDQLVFGSSKPVTVYGFKETRYTRAQLKEDGISSLGPYLDFLAEIFPSPAFIVLTREHAAAAASSFWRHVGTAMAHEQMSLFDQDVADWAAPRSDVLCLDYDEALTGPRPYGRVFDFLGATYDEARVKQVLGTQHSDDNRNAMVRSLPWPGSVQPTMFDFSAQ